LLTRLRNFQELIMNHAYRIVFNRALGLCQVVSELASAHDGGAAKAVRLMLRPSLLANACLLALGMTVVATAGAQTVIENRVMEVDSPADLSGDVTLGSNGELRATADVTLGNRLRIQAATTPTISATAGTTLTLSGGYDLGHEAGLAFGSAGHTGTVVYSAFGYQYQGTPGALNVNYGTLRAGTTYLPSLLQDMLSTNIAAGATLDLNDQNRSIPTASITNLQGTGTLVTGTLADSVVAIDEGTFAGAIIGAGGIEKRGSGTLVLGGINTFTGGTTVSGGTLVISSDDNLGAVTGDLMLDGGTLKTTVGILSARSLNLGSRGGVVDVVPGYSLVLTGVISGNALTKTGGMLLLAGNNTYTGPTISSGTLQVGAGGTTGTLGGGEVINNGQLTFSRSDALAVDNAISGTGQLLQGGHGTTTLTGTNTYAGATMITSGTLQVGRGGTTGTLGSGKVINDAALVFNRSDALAVNNVISGSGTLFQAGAGKTTLSGINTYTGNTTIGNGTLAINGSVMSDVQVNAAGTLGGNGHIGGNVNVLGTLSAGNSPGTLSIGGNLVLGTGSKSVFELGQADVVGGPANDLVEVDGDLTIGGTLQAQAASAGWYRLFNYGGTLSGAFGVTDVSSSRVGFTVASHALDTANANQVNLTVLAAGQSIQFWDGSNTTPSGRIGGAGGIGNWNSADTTWTNDSATTNSNWGGSVAHFGGTAGIVSVVGTQRFDTLQFASDGYVLTGGTLALSPASGSYATINTDTGVSATA
jgi:autotransporter-associated beta strand protein